MPPFLSPEQLGVADSLGIPPLTREQLRLIPSLRDSILDFGAYFVEDQFDDHIGSFMEVVDGDDPVMAWMEWWDIRRELGDHREPWVMAPEIRENDQIFAGFQAWQANAFRYIKRVSPHGRLHRRAPRTRNRRGARCRLLRRPSARARGPDDPDPPGGPAPQARRETAERVA